jgi:hypothetical protein
MLNCDGVEIRFRGFGYWLLMGCRALVFCWRADMVMCIHGEAWAFRSS